jgi:UDP-perosamine 4-acetyltransferase
MDTYHRPMPDPRPSGALPIVGLGAGMHAKSLLEAIHSRGEFEVAVLADDDPACGGSDVLGIAVEGPDALTGALERGVAHAFVGIGGIGSTAARRAVFSRLLEAGFELPPILHETAIVSPWATVGRGSQVFARAVVNAGAEIGDDVIVNTGAIVEHDCRIAAHAHVSPGALLAGLVEVGEDTHVGIGAVVIQSIRIGAGALVAAGAVVVDDVRDGARVAGVPARELPLG